MVKTGTKVQHISNNAPFSLADFGSPEADTRRKARLDAHEFAAGARPVDSPEVLAALTKADSL